MRSGRARPVHVVGMRADVFVHEREDGFAAAGVAVLGVPLGLVAVVGVVLAALSQQACALDHVEEMGNDAHLRPQVAVLIEVDAPRIAAALGEDLEAVRHRMVAPHAGVHPLAIRLGRSRFADMRWAEHAVAAVEPAIGSPVEGVERLVRVGGVVPAIEQDLRVTGRLRCVAVGDRDEHQVRGGTDPEAAEAELHAGNQVHVFEEHRALVGLVVAVGVFEDEDAVFAGEDVFAELLRSAIGRRMADALGVTQAFSHPDAAAVIFAEGDGVADVGFGREDVHREAGGQRGLGGGVGSGQPGEEHLIGRRGRVFGRVFQAQFVGQHRTLGVEAEVVEIDMTPVAGAVIDQADEDLLTHQTLQFDDDRSQGFVLVAGDLEEGLAGRGVHQFDAGLGPWTASDQEACPRMGHLEGDRSQRALGVVAHAFESANPEVAFVVGLHVSAPL